MARPGKASNGTSAASAAVLVALSCWTIAIEANRLGSNNESMEKLGVEGIFR
jgi:hypothetical protein